MQRKNQSSPINLHQNYQSSNKTPPQSINMNKSTSNSTSKNFIRLNKAKVSNIYSAPRTKSQEPAIISKPAKESNQSKSKISSGSSAKPSMGQMQIQPKPTESIQELPQAASMPVSPLKPKKSSIHSEKSQKISLENFEKHEIIEPVQSLNENYAANLSHAKASQARMSVIEEGPDPSVAASPDFMMIDVDRVALDDSGEEAEINEDFNERGEMIEEKINSEIYNENIDVENYDKELEKTMDSEDKDKDREHMTPKSKYKESDMHQILHSSSHSESINSRASRMNIDLSNRKSRDHNYSESFKSSIKDYNTGMNQDYEYVNEPSAKMQIDAFPDLVIKNTPTPIKISRDSVQSANEPMKASQSIKKSQRTSKSITKDSILFYSDDELINCKKTQSDNDDVMSQCSTKSLQAINASGLPRSKSVKSSSKRSKRYSRSSKKSNLSSKYSVKSKINQISESLIEDSPDKKETSAEKIPEYEKNNSPIEDKPEEPKQNESVEIFESPQKSMKSSAKVSIHSLSNFKSTGKKSNKNLTTEKSKKSESNENSGNDHEISQDKVMIHDQVRYHTRKYDRMIQVKDLPTQTEHEKIERKKESSFDQKENYEKVVDDHQLRRSNRLAMKRRQEKQNEGPIKRKKSKKNAGHKKKIKY